jgi:hypothetical protein
MRTPSENNGNKKNDHAGERPTAGDYPGSSTAIRKIFKVLCNPQLAVAILNAQPLSFKFELKQQPDCHGLYACTVEFISGLVETWNLEMALA